MEWLRRLFIPISSRHAWKAKPQIAIIGAGLAGLTSAYRLQQKGYMVDVFEARPRVGGRVHSVYLQNFEGGYSVGELGGQNIADGGKAENILALSREFNLDTVEDDHELSVRYYHENKIYNPQDLLKTYPYGPKEIKKILNSFDPSIHSLNDVMEMLFAGHPLLKKMFHFLISSYEGSPPHQLSLYHNLETLENMLIGRLALAKYKSEEVPTIKRISIKGGNGQLPMAVSEKLSKPVHFHKVLRKVIHEESGKIKLTFADGTSSLCDQLILAIPCSVYEDIAFDERVIPRERLDLIKKVQYGTNGKVLMPVTNSHLAYTAAFTDEMVAFFNDDKKAFNLFYPGLGGAHLIENLQKSFDEAMNALKKCFEQASFGNNSPVIADDNQFGKYKGPVAKSWAQDAFAKGSYSNYSLELNEMYGSQLFYKEIKIKTLFSPIQDRIFFVGEHATILDEIGTMEAAVESGERISTLF